MICKFCKQEFEEKELDAHHIHPRFMDNPKGDDQKIYLCKKCHHILHLVSPKILWVNIPEESKPSIIKKVISYTKNKGGMK